MHKECADGVLGHKVTPLKQGTVPSSKAVI